MAEVKLHGFWVSPFTHRVIWALKIKGIDYEYIEEDLSNKSQLLLKYNPVYKTVPVLVHAGKPIAESLIILEYIEETWPENPSLPSDPCERAMARFWIQFAVEKMPATVWLVFRTKGEDQDKAVKESLGVLQTIEEHGLGNEKKFFGGDNINMLDIAYGGLAYMLEIVEDVAGKKLLEPHKFPRLSKWIENFKQIPVIKDNLPDRDATFLYLKSRRQMLLASK